MSRLFPSIIWMTIVWVALWEDLTWANLIGGAAVGVFVNWLVPLRTPVARHGIRPLALVRLLAVFGRELVEASALMAWEVVTPHNRINAAVVGVPLKSRSRGIVTHVANMVSLTPGTLTLEVEEETMTIYIHVLHLDSVEATRRAVLRLEELAMAAFPLRSLSTDEEAYVGEGH